MSISAIFFLIILTFYNITAFQLKLTNLKCNVIDKDFVKIDKCRVKAESRDLQYYMLYIKFMQLPIKEFKVRFKFLKRANGYKPFLYDFTLKCDFLKHLNPVSTILWKWFTEASNLNHSCPLTEDFEIKRLTNHLLLKDLSTLPMPGGDYAFVVTADFANLTRFILEFYASAF